jgi:NADPH:quinone reductase-like Zn-dependent oxidoreductase
MAEVLVEIETVAVNPVDTYVRSGSCPTLVPMPFIIGRDLVGTVAPHGSCRESSRPFQSEDQLTGSSKHLICVGLWGTVKDNIIEHRSFVIPLCDDGKV